MHIEAVKETEVSCLMKTLDRKPKKTLNPISPKP